MPHEHFPPCFGEELRILREQARRASEDDVRAVGQRLWQARKGLPAHQHNASRGEFLEPPEILRQMPWNLAPAPDDAVEGHRSDRFQIAGGGTIGGGGGSSS